MKLTILPSTVVDVSFLSQKTVRAMLNRPINAINSISDLDIVMKMCSTPANVMIPYILMSSFAFFKNGSRNVK